MKHPALHVHAAATATDDNFMVPLKLNDKMTDTCGKMMKVDYLMKNYILLLPKIPVRNIF